MLGLQRLEVKFSWNITRYFVEKMAFEVRLGGRLGLKSAEDGLRARLAEVFTTRSVTGVGEAGIAD